MTRRSIILVSCGVVAVLVGLAVAFLGRSDDDSAAASAKVAVVVADAAIEAGTEGTDAAAQGLLVVKEVEAGDVRPGALRDPSQLAGRTFAVSVASGGQVLSSDLNTPALRDASIEVPEGTQAVAIEVPFINGAAGYAAPGDAVNVFTLLDPADGPTVVTELSTVDVVSNVVVLDVSQQVAPRVASQGGTAGATATPTTQAAAANPTQLTYLLAVPTARVTSLVQAAAFHRLYISIPAKGTPPTPAGLISDADLAGGGR